MINDETYLGSVQNVNGTTVNVSISKESLTGFIYIDGQGYRIGQIGSFIRIPIGFIDLFGIISQVGASSVSENQIENQPYGNRWMTLQLIGEGQRNGTFQRGISQYPTIGDEVHLVSEKELERIYGQPDKPYFVKLGHVANAESIPALVDMGQSWDDIGKGINDTFLSLCPGTIFKWDEVKESERYFSTKTPEGKVEKFVYNTVTNQIENLSIEVEEAGEKPIQRAERKKPTCQEQ